VTLGVVPADDDEMGQMSEALNEQLNRLPAEAREWYHVTLLTLTVATSSPSPSPSPSP
jgi:hypothetical protein